MEWSLKSLAVAFLALTLMMPREAAAQEPADTDVEPQVPWVMPPSGPFTPESIRIPNADAIEAWIRSGHSDASSESFAHWDEEGEIPPVCSVCHSGAGFRSFHGLDGSQPGLPEAPVPVGGVVDCATCHNPGLAQVTEITLPSGVVHPVTGGEASCLTCHQGRAAGSTIVEATQRKPEDAPDAELGFINPHYRVAAATWLGGYGAMGYHYPGKSYSGRFLHAKPVATCASCHDPHSLEVAELVCLTCHQQGEAEAIRISRQSYDGSGDTSKGIAADIRANADVLQSMLLDYAADVAGTPMIYDAHRYPYFFADANGDGVVDQSEGRAQAYAAWTPRLLKAAYNWKFVTADPGVHVHNPHYALELLYDSIEDLSGPLAVDFAALGLQR